MEFLEQDWAGEKYILQGARLFWLFKYSPISYSLLKVLSYYLFISRISDLLIQFKNNLLKSICIEILIKIGIKVLLVICH